MRCKRAPVRAATAQLLLVFPSVSLATVKNKPQSMPGETLRTQRKQSNLCDEHCALAVKRIKVLPRDLIAILQPEMIHS